MGRSQEMRRASTIFSGTTGFQRLFMPPGHSDASYPEQQRTNKQGEKEWVHVPFQRLTRPPVVGGCLTGIPVDETPQGSHPTRGCYGGMMPAMRVMSTSHVTAASMPHGQGL